MVRQRGAKVGRPTVNDIARTAKVSLATVDRVLNARPGVRRETIERVTQAVEALGYVRDVAAANLARQRSYRFVVALPDAGDEFARALRAAMAGAARMVGTDRVSVEVVGFPAEDPHALAELLNGLAARDRTGRRRVDGVAVTAAETPHVRDAIRRLKREGVAVAALVSDLPNTERDHFVGVDNVAAGRTAGVLMGRFVGPQGGAVAVLARSMLLRESIERRLGLDAVLARDFPAVVARPSLEGRGDQAAAARALAAQTARLGPALGVYLLGADVGALDALPPAPDGARPVVIAHELTPGARAALGDGRIDAVITQDLGHVARSALRVLRARSDGVAIDPAQERIRIEIVIRENLPAQTGPDREGETT